MLQHATVSKNDDYSQQTGLGAHLTGVADVSLWDLRGLLYLVQLCSILSYKVGPSLHPIMVNELTTAIAEVAEGRERSTSVSTYSLKLITKS